MEIGDWLKQEGDAVKKDENVVVIETDKATVEIAAPAAGRLSKIVKQKGERVSVGDIVGYLEEGDGEAQGKPEKTASKKDEDESKKAPKPEKQKPPSKETGKAKPAKSEAPASESAAAKPSDTKAEPPLSKPALKGATQARVMPAAARLMAERGVSPGAVEPTGPGGRVLKEDVQRAAAEGVAHPAETPAAAPEPAPPAASGAAGGDREEEVVPMSLLRRKIARAPGAGPANSRAPHHVQRN